MAYHSRKHEAIPAGPAPGTHLVILNTPCFLLSLGVSPFLNSWDLRLLSAPASPLGLDSGLVLVPSAFLPSARSESGPTLTSLHSLEQVIVSPLCQPVRATPRRLAGSQDGCA